MAPSYVRAFGIGAVHAACSPRAPSGASCHCTTSDIRAARTISSSAMPSSLLALALSVAIPMKLQVFPSDHPTLPAGERWAYEVEAPHGAHRTGRIELSVFADASRQRAVARLPGLAVAEVVGRPRAVMFALMLARGQVFADVMRTSEESRTAEEWIKASEAREDEPVAALAWLLHANAPHLEASC